MMFEERSSGVRNLNIGETKRRRLTLPKMVIQNCFAWQTFEGTKISALGSLYCNYKLVGYRSSYLMFVSWPKLNACALIHQY